MLFNSFVFILVFLPISLLAFHLAARIGPRLQVMVISLASLTFYSFWDPRYLALLLGSVVFNFVIGRRLSSLPEGDRSAFPLFVVGIGANLAALAYYKYVNFFVDNLNAVGLSLPHLQVILPLGISFFTFTQIAFLVDAYSGLSDEPDFIQYLAFVTYFPHLIAGPILHHHEMIPQFRTAGRLRSHWIAPGLALFSIGLAKKVVLADVMGAVARPIFDAFAKGTTGLTGLDAWVGSLCYTFQLYFDFSAYSDMAVGLSLMFGIYLPLNFSSPYKATSIIDFWHRWHMTLSRYLRDYVYMPLALPWRGSGVAAYLSLMLTMLIGGLWHGAGWTFLIWGGLHGAYLAVNHAWRWRFPVGAEATRRAWIGRSLTFVSVVVAWVFFRASSVSSAFSMVRAMLLGPWTLSPPIASSLAAALIPRAAIDAGIQHSLWSAAALILVGLAIVWLFPNSQEIVFRESPWRLPLSEAAPPVAWRSPWWLVPLTSFAFVLGLLALIAAPPGEFLYFNF
jgi:alginate O-acetyltransferase complex protein AlgI